MLRTYLRRHQVTCSRYTKRANKPLIFKNKRAAKSLSVPERFKDRFRDSPSSQSWASRPGTQQPSTPHSRLRAVSTESTLGLQLGEPPWRGHCRKTQRQKGHRGTALPVGSSSWLCRPGQQSPRSNQWFHFRLPHSWNQRHAQPACTPSSAEWAPAPWGPSSELLWQLGATLSSETRAPAAWGPALWSRCQ